MTVIALKAGALSARISTRGGIVLGFWWDRGGERVPLLRDAPSDDADALSSGCYPLVPFGNRVKDNRFTFDGQDYSLVPNTEWDRHYLHGEGWQDEWTVLSSDPASVELGFAHAGGGTPYRYAAKQRFALSPAGLEMTLTVTNKGSDPLPFGLGWHPYFPMTPKTTLQANTRRFWTEVADWLPGEATDMPADLDFTTPSGLPHRWVNNGFEGWSGTAEIVWPEHGARLELSADPLFRHAFIFVSDTAFDPSFRRDYFCFEPMSHLANGHNLRGLGDLVVLNGGEELSGSIRLRPQGLPASGDLS
jgi:aldose 1-epimerase